MNNVEIIMTRSTAMDMVRLNKKEREKIISGSRKALTNSIASQSEINSRTAREAHKVIYKHKK